MQMVESVEVFIVVWSPYITLKLFWIKGPLFYTFHQAFYKDFVTLMF